MREAKGHPDRKGISFFLLTCSALVLILLSLVLLPMVTGKEDGGSIGGVHFKICGGGGIWKGNQITRRWMKGMDGPEHWTTRGQAGGR